MFTLFRSMQVIHYRLVAVCQFCGVSGLHDWLVLSRDILHSILTDAT